MTTYRSSARRKQLLLLPGVTRYRPKRNLKSKDDKDEMYACSEEAAKFPFNTPPEFR